MKINKTHGILLGLGVLGITSALGAFQPAQAAPRGEVTQIQYRPYRNRRAPIGRPAFGRAPYGRSYQTLTGRVTRDYAGNGFLLRTNGGSTYRVVVAGGEPRRVSIGDRIQVSGFYRDGAFRAQRYVMLRNR